LQEWSKIDWLWVTLSKRLTPELSRNFARLAGAAQPTCAELGIHFFPNAAGNATAEKGKIA
jgi:hypothetical protein